MQEYTIDQEFEGSKLYVTGMLSPQRGLEIEVNRTFDPFSDTQFDENGYKVKDAVVEIFEGDQFLDYAIQDSSGVYISLQPEIIKQGKTYSVMISAAGLPAVKIDQITIPEWEEKSQSKIMYEEDAGSRTGKLDVDLVNSSDYALYYIRGLLNEDKRRAIDMGLNKTYEVNEACHYAYQYFSNLCSLGSRIVLQFDISYKWRENKKPTQFIYFEIAKIDPNYRIYTLEDDAGFDSYAVPILHQGNVENGYGYIVGKNVLEYTYYK